MVVTEELKLLLNKQQYGSIGKHSRVKVCHWTKSDLKGKGGCYKHKFYGIKSHQCTQMTPTFTCNNACVFCWRDLRYHTAPAMEDGVDNPKNIVEESIKKQIDLLIGFGGNPSVGKEKLNEALNPKHVAISLDGEPTLYPHLAELIGEYKKRNMSTFLVSNGLMPEKIKALMEEPPTQLYISVDAPNEELFEEIDRPLVKKGWEKLMTTLDLLKEMREKGKTRTVLRFTLIKGMNMCYPKQWAEAIKRANAMFVEVKAYMWIGMSRERLEQRNMPYHEEVKKFAQEIANHAGYQIIDEHQPSRVVLLMKEDFDGRIMDFKGD